MAIVGRGHHPPRIQVAPIGQIQQTVLDPDNAFDGRVDHLVVLWRIEDLVADDLDRFLGGDDDAGERIVAAVDELVSVVARGPATGVATTMSIPGLPLDGTLDLRDPAISLRLGGLHGRIVASALSVARDVSGLGLVDLDALQRTVGITAFDAAKWMLYRQPYSSDMLAAIADALATAIERSSTPTPKVLALDCDGTLWGGIVGEDGPGGIELGNEFPGRAYADFQRVCRRMQRSGVMLVIVSKNNHEDVVEVFERHDGMVLRTDDIAAWRVNWEPKSDNLASLAAELNVGLDSFVFVDDSPHEIAEVAARVPEVTSVMVPEDIEGLPALLAESGLFRDMRTSDVDAQRTRMMHEEQAREQTAAAMSKEEFLASLDLTVDYFAPEPEHLARVTQLIGKTNQFNMTTIRRTAAEVAALAESDSHIVRAIRVSDRFGDYGLVGVAIVERTPSHAAIDTFLMSCRVLGRGVESAFLAALVDELGAGVSVRGEYRPTRKNAAVAEFYVDHGFTQLDDGVFELAPGGAIDAPDHVAVVRS